MAKSGEYRRSKSSSKWDRLVACQLLFQPAPSGLPKNSSKPEKTGREGCPTNSESKIYSLVGQASRPVWAFQQPAHV